MKHKSRFILAFAMLIDSAGAVDPNEFAVGWPLALAEDSAFYDITLTADSYRHARSVSQMAVLDANGEPMPFYRVAVEPGPSTEETRTLGVSPVYQTQGGEVIAGLTVEASDESVSLAFAPDSPGDPRIVAFVADARALDVEPRAIDLDWTDIAQPFMTSVVVSHSEDLDRWETIGRGTIASLVIDGARVRHTRIPLEGRAGGYYRIGRSETMPAPWVLERLSLVIEREPETASVELVSLATVDAPTGTEVGADDHSLYFDAGGLLPARALEVVFSQPNRWANVAVFGADSPEGPWQRLTSRRLYYRVDFEGRQLSRPAVTLTGGPVRYWRVTPDRALDEGGVELRLHYAQERLRFAANGTSPYQLVGGGLSSDAGPDPVLRQVWGQLDEDLAGSMAELGAMQELGGDSAFVPPSEFPWRSTFLWAALLLGAASVGWMAFRLGRDAFTGA